MFKVAIIALSIISLSLQYKLWFKEEGGISGIIKIRTEIKKQEENLINLKQRNFELLESIKTLKENPNTVEEYARVIFGMIKKDEAYYRVID